MHLIDQRRWGRAKTLKAGTIVREQREKAGITAKEMCSRISMSHSQLSDIERGIQSLSLRRAQQFAKIFPQAAEAIVAAVLQDKLDEAGMGEMTVRVSEVQDQAGVNGHRHGE